MNSSRFLHRRAIMGLLLANLFWGLSFPLIKALGLLHERLIPEAGTWFSTLYLVAPRFVLATAILAVCWARELGRITRDEVVQGVAIGLFAAAGMLFGIPSLRIKGLYLAVSTLAAQFFIDWLFARVKWFTDYAHSGSVSPAPVFPAASV